MPVPPKGVVGVMGSEPAKRGGQRTKGGNAKKMPKGSEHSDAMVMVKLFPKARKDAATLRYYPLAPVPPKGVMGVMGSERNGQRVPLKV